MIKPINLYVISRIQNEISFNRVESHASGKKQLSKTKNHEIDSLRRIVDRLTTEYSVSRESLDGFFLGYQIPQIGKEFDLLKFSPKFCLNIEYKSRMVPELQIKQQLLKNRHYLSHLKKEIATYTVITSTFSCYSLNANDELVSVDFGEIAKTIINFPDIYEVNIDGMFRISDFLVSPLNTPNRFINGEYFLTPNQEDVKKKMLSSIDGKNRYIALTGKPGTGKTLLLYDIAKELAISDVVLIIHCGKITEGQRIIKRTICNLSIKAIGELRYESNGLDGYKYILLDEAQRIYKTQFDKICKHIKENGQIGIFSFDPGQVLSKAERDRNISDNIESLENAVVHELSEKIRTNKELASFIKYVLNLNNPPHEVMNYENVSLAYANNEDEAKNIIDYARSKGYVFINYSKSNKNYSPYSQYEEDVDTHHVIGQEFDKIIMLLDNSFYYDENNQLKGVTHPNPDYLYEKLFYQGVTRVREKLALVVVKAPDLFEKITSIFEEKSEKKDGNIT